MTHWLHFICPLCSRRLTKVEGMPTATTVVKRRCPGCTRRWLVVSTPAHGERRHSVTLTEVPRAVTVIE